MGCQIPPQKRRLETSRIVAIYALFGFAWIYGSDTLLGWVVQDHAVMVKIAVVKGSLFILCTSILLYFLISRFAQQLSSAEAEQIESLRNYQTIFNATSEAIFIHDAQNGCILDINNRVLEIYGYNREEALMLDVGGISSGTSPYSQSDAFGKLQKVIQEGPQTFEWLCRKKSGELFWTEVSLRRITSNDFDRIIAVVRDISDRKQLYDALQKREERHRTILDSAMDGFWLVSKQGRLLEVNKAYCHMSGYSKQELLEMSIHDFEVIESTDDVIAHNLKIMEQGEDRFISRHRRKDGTVFDVEVSSKFIPVDGGLLVGFLRDISDLKLAEKQLDERKRLFDTLLAHLPVGVFMVETPSGKPLIANNKALELLGRGILPDTSKENLTELYEAYKYGTKERYPVEQMPIVRGMYGESTAIDDLIVVRPDGTSKLLGISGTPVLGADGKTWASLVCFQDITERKERENQELKIQKLESLGILAGGIAHDFNNILTGIMGNLSLAKMHIEETHQSYNALAGAEKASVRATELARQLLTFARGGEPVKKVVSLQHIVNESASMVMHGSNVKCIIDIPETIHDVEVDEGQIIQAFHNIIINATQAMPAGGTLVVSAQNVQLDRSNHMTLPSGSYILLTFTDEGCGIRDEDITKIFDPYFTTKESGNGLGLASTHSIICKHKGSIYVNSVVNQGSTFSIYLPSIGTINKESQTESATQVSNMLHCGSILVMDDEEMIRDLVTGMLEDVGYDVVTCVDGAEAIKHYTSAMESGTPFSAVIMDLTIPGGMGGKEAADKLIALDPAACLLVSSGYSNDPIMSDFRTYGFSGTIEKPYRISELVNTLDFVLSHRSNAV